MSSTLDARVGTDARLLPAGLAVWVVTLVVLPAPLAARILLLAPLVVVPRLTVLFPARSWTARLAGCPTLLAALPLPIAFALPTGLVASVFALPWLALALSGALAAVLHGLSRLPSILRSRQLPELGIDVALGFWAVGASFIVVDRLGVETGFSPAIVLLTATHFHFAGVGLLGLTSLLASSRPWLRWSVLGLIAGIPLTAVGFVLVTDAVSAIGAVLVGLSGIGAAIAMLTTPAPGHARWLPRMAGAALLIGMPMGIAWSVATLSGQTFLNLDTMIRTHGVLNATAVLVGVISHHADRS